MKRLIIVVAMACIAQLSYSQITCPEPLTVTVPGSTAGAPLDATGIPEDSGCNAASGGLSGSIDVTVTGGSPSFIFNWTGPNGFTATTEDLADLGAGQYFVTITDDQGCTMELDFTIEEPEPLVITGVETDPLCSPDQGVPSGTIVTTTVVGTTDYTYAWTGPNGFTATTADVNGLEAGSYTVIVTDAENCTATASFTIEDVDPIAVNASIEDLECNTTINGPTGTITLEILNATDPINFTWTGPNGFTATTQNLTGLEAGIYNLNFTDNNGCSFDAEYEITEPEAVVCSLQSPTPGACGEHILCNGGTGTINATASGGTGVYEYSLDGTNFQSSPTFTVAAGTHTVTVRDESGCISTCDITLTEPTLLEGATCINPDECQTGEGEIQVQAAGGCAPYNVTYTTTGADLVPAQSGSLDITTDGGTATFTGATGGVEYIFTITDANGCVIGG